MENNIELFELYIDNKLDPEEKQTIESRIKSDRDFASDFRIYLFALRGMMQEAEQDNIEFGHAMKSLSKADLLRIIGRSSRPRILRPGYLRERLAWTASIAAVLIVGVFMTLHVRQAGMNRIDDAIVAYNYIPDTYKGGESIAADDIPALETAYRTAPADDIQAQEDAGMRLAMAYLKVHDRKMAKQVLNELSRRFADDEEFASQCNKILNQLK